LARRVRAPPRLSRSCALVENGFYKQLGRLVVVASSEETQILRVMARDGCAREAALADARAASPGRQDPRRRLRLDNNGDIEATRAQLEHILAGLVR